MLFARSISTKTWPETLAIHDRCILWIFRNFSKNWFGIGFAGLIKCANTHRFCKRVYLYLISCTEVFCNETCIPIQTCILLFPLLQNLCTSIPGGPQKKRNSRYSRFFRTLLWLTVIFFTLLDRASFPHYNNTKIIKFGWELFISWVISYALSFSGFARFPESRGTINDKLITRFWNLHRHRVHPVPVENGLMANPENDSP